MKKIFFIFLFFISLFTQAQITFQKIYGGTNFDFCSSIQKTNDGAFIITGQTSSFGIGGFDTYLVKIAYDGSLLWAKTFGGLYPDGGNSIQQTIDGGFIIAGMTNSFGDGDVYILKTDSIGTLQWSKNFGGTGYDESKSVQQTNDGGFIIAGYTSSFGAGYFDVYLIKISSDGNLMWTKTYGGTGDDEGFCVHQTSEGGFIVGGYTNSFGTENNYLIKTTFDGNLQWTKTYAGTGYSVQQTTDGGFAITGATTLGAGNFDVCLIKSSSDGTLQWSKTFGNTGVDVGYFTEQTNDGGFIISGFTFSSGAGGPDIYVIKTTLNGSLQWSKTFGGTGDDSGTSIHQTNEGGFIIGGNTTSFGTGGVCNNDIYIIYTDSDGNSGCNETNPNTIVTTTTIVGNPATQVSSGGIVGNPATQTGSGGIETTLCSTAEVNDFQNTKPEINIFPNPFSTETVIQVASLKSKVLSLNFSLYDVFGREVKNFRLTTQDYRLERGNLPGGIYFYKLSNSTEVIGSGKIVVE